jgi:hypothetical protein
MKFVADENFPRYALRLLRQCGFDVASIAEINPGLPTPKSSVSHRPRAERCSLSTRTSAISASVKACQLRVESSYSEPARSRRRSLPDSPLPRSNRASLGPGTSVWSTTARSASLRCRPGLAARDPDFIALRPRQDDRTRSTACSPAIQVPHDSLVRRWTQFQFPVDIATDR